MGTFLDNFIILSLAVSIIALTASIYGIAQNDNNTCGANYIASVASSAVFTGSTLILLFVVLIRINNLCPFSSVLPSGNLMLNPDAYSNMIPQALPPQLNPQQYLPYLAQLFQQR